MFLLSMSFNRTVMKSHTVSIIKEVSDGGRGAAAPGFGGVDGGQDRRHEPLVFGGSKPLLTEL